MHQDEAVDLVHGPQRPLFAHRSLTNMTPRWASRTTAGEFIYKKKKKSRSGVLKLWYTATCGTCIWMHFHMQWNRHSLWWGLKGHSYLERCILGRKQLWTDVFKINVWFQFTNNWQTRTLNNHHRQNTDMCSRTEEFLWKERLQFHLKANRKFTSCHVVHSKPLLSCC